MQLKMRRVRGNDEEVAKACSAEGATLVQELTTDFTFSVIWVQHTLDKATASVETPWVNRLLHHYPVKQTISHDNYAAEKAATKSDFRVDLDAPYIILRGSYICSLWAKVYHSTSSRGCMNN
jgi:hypothetical protein